MVTTRTCPGETSVGFVAVSEVFEVAHEVDGTTIIAEVRSGCLLKVTEVVNIQIILTWGQQHDWIFCQNLLVKTCFLKPIKGWILFESRASRVLLWIFTILLCAWTRWIWTEVPKWLSSWRICKWLQWPSMAWLQSWFVLFFLCHLMRS